MDLEREINELSIFGGSIILFSTASASSLALVDRLSGLGINVRYGVSNCHTEKEPLMLVEKKFAEQEIFISIISRATKATENPRVIHYRYTAAECQKVHVNDSSREANARNILEALGIIPEIDAGRTSNEKPT